MSIIILEGIDRAGKTTLAKELCRRLKLKYIKVSNPKGDPYEEYLNLILNVKVPTLFDRLHLGELVYGPVLRGKSQLDTKKFRNLEFLLKQRGAVIVYAHNSYEFIKQKFIEDHETFLNAEKIKQVQRLYEKKINSSILPVNRYKIGDGYNNITSWAKLHLNRAMNKTCLKTRVIGSRLPTILLIGEINNVNNTRYQQLPFDFGPASNYLFNRLLKKVDRDLDVTAITNAFKAHLKQGMLYQLNLLKKEVKELKPKIIVALGNTAYNFSKAAVGKDYDIIKIPHPQYLSRFKHNSSKYVKVLKEIYGQ